ncbi:type IV pilin protein [Neisseriaceae bacterium B1]
MNLRFKQNFSGFSLTEMMIAIVILGILAAVALPSYQSYVEKTNLSEAKTTITGIYQSLENEKMTNSRNLATEQAVRTFVNARIASIPAAQTAKYAFTPLVSADGKIFNVNIQATPIREGNKFFLWSSSNGTVSKCKLSGGSPSITATQPSNCEAF